MGVSVGYVNGGRSGEQFVFYSEDKRDDFHLPLNRQTYVFHPILIDAVGIRSVGTRPVIPFDGE